MPNLKLVWLPLALDDLEAIRDYIYPDNPKAAQDMVRRVFVAVKKLQAMPQIGRPGRVISTRELVVDRTPYIVPYRVKDDRVEILRVYDGRRQWPDTL